MQDYSKQIEYLQQIMLIALAYSYEDVDAEKAMNKVVEICLDVSNSLNKDKS